MCAITSNQSFRPMDFWTNGTSVCTCSSLLHNRMGSFSSPKHVAHTSCISSLPSQWNPQEQQHSMGRIGRGSRTERCREADRFHPMLRRRWARGGLDFFPGVSKRNDFEMLKLTDSPLSKGSLCQVQRFYLKVYQSSKQIHRHFLAL